MEILASRTEAQLVLTLSGRMDGTGSQQVTAAIQQNLTDHDTVLIFDLAGVDYLSSAGLRVFQESARKMKEKSGRVAVCSVQDFVRKLFTSGGFFRVITEFPTRQDALNGTASTALSAGEVRVTGNGWSLSAQHLSGTPGPLTVTGNLQAIHDGRITPGDVRKGTPAPGSYRAGIGAIASTPGAAAPLLGEMVQAKGTVYWIPTDGNSNPDFFTAEDLGASGMETYSLFSASFSGPFTEVIRITSEKAEGMTLAEVYAAIFQYLRAQESGFSGVCAVTLKATIGGLCSSDLKTPLIAAAEERRRKGPAAMPVGHTVTEYPVDGTVIEKVSVIDVKPKYSGDVLISVGFGVDPALARKTFSPEDLAAITFSGSRSGNAGLFLYNKGMVFRKLSWDNAKPFEEQLPAAMAGGEFIALHNLLNITTVKSAIAGILPISAIRHGN